MLQVCMIVRAVALHTVWYHERNNIHVVPILQDVVVALPNGKRWTANFMIYDGGMNDILQCQMSLVAVGTRQWPEPSVFVGWAKRGVCACAFRGRQTGARDVFLPSDCNVLFWKSDRIECNIPGQWPTHRDDWSVVIIDNEKQVREVRGHDWTPIWISSYTGYGRRRYVICFRTNGSMAPNVALQFLRSEVHIALAMCGFLVRKEWALAQFLLC
jgi:hypothetical protein